MLTIHLDKELSFPRPASWNLTVYGVDKFKPAGSINSYSVNKSRIEYNYDGSIEILIQSDDPGPAKQHNWLRAPNGEFFLVMRVSWSDNEVPHKQEPNVEVNGLEKSELPGEIV
jgi:hypothetical protein